ncbi:hypothetical protein [Thermococcus sp. LS2]|nr:hypothetical protein [Thermococcus sp. LS2]
MRQFVTSSFKDNARILTTIVFLKSLKIISYVKRGHESAVFGLGLEIKTA